MEQFYIDRQFGQAIFIDVEKGIVQKCYNETEKFCARMNELYAGKSINFLKEDFIGRAMKDTYHSLRPMELTHALQRLEGTKSRLRNLWTMVSDYNITKDKKEEIQIAIKELELEQYKYEKELEATKKRILEEHNFVF